MATKLEEDVRKFAVSRLVVSRTISGLIGCFNWLLSMLPGLMLVFHLAADKIKRLEPVFVTRSAFETMPPVSFSTRKLAGRYPSMVPISLVHWYVKGKQHVGIVLACGRGSLYAELQAIFDGS